MQRLIINFMIDGVIESYLIVKYTWSATKRAFNLNKFYDLMAELYVWAHKF